MALALDPTQILRAQGITPDPWQAELLYSTARSVLLGKASVIRQSGTLPDACAEFTRSAGVFHRRRQLRP